MTKKKNIDHYFQERFQNFEAAPAEETWMNIEAQLDKKKKRRIIPFWWKFSGVAAVLLLGLFIAKSSFTAVEGSKNPIVTDSNPTKTTNNGSALKTDKAASPIGVAVLPSKEKSKTLINSNTTTKDKDNLLVNATTTSIGKDNLFVNNNAVPKAKNSQTPLNRVKKDWLTNKTERIGYTQSKTSKVKKGKHIPASLMVKTTPQIAQNPATISTNHNDLNVPSKNEDYMSAINEPNKSIRINTDVNTDLNTPQKIIAQETTLNDTTKIKGVATNPLEELLSEKESKTKQQSKENSWQISSNVAPVFLGSVTNGSPIDPMFKNNSKTFNTSMSMGIGVSYALNHKFTVRTGINKMSFNYDTKGIAFYVDLQENGMTNLSPSASGKEITVVNATSEADNLLPFENSFVHKNEGYINQKLGYYEVPVEITYAIINKRFGLKVIGGVSTFFLNENSIAVVSESFSTTLGKANNLNDMHFSTNLGLGLKYGFMKSFEFNVEPTIKYQLNTFQSNAGNFKPYVIGLYSGISYKF